MKKLLIAPLALVLALGLCACALFGGGGGAADGGSQTAGEELDLTPLMPAEDEPTTEELMAASESDAAALANDMPLASDTDAALDDDAYETAQRYIGQPVEALYELIGQPESAQYAASCLEDGAEDGMLFYSGFYLWTIRSESGELIHAVYRMD